MKAMFKEALELILGGVVLAILFLGAMLISNYLNYGTFLF